MREVFPTVIGGIGNATLTLGVSAVSGYFDMFLIIISLIIVKWKIMRI